MVIEQTVQKKEIEATVCCVKRGGKAEFQVVCVLQFVYQRE